MQQRRLRLGDILDDYCPRERRVTNHAVVAMVEDEVKQTRCTTCDAEHEYKQAKMPLLRRKKTVDAPPGAIGTGARPRPASEPVPTAAADVIDTAVTFASSEADAPDGETLAALPDNDGAAPGDTDDVDSALDDRPSDDDGPVHRPLIRATLPRPEGQTPERKATDFTVRQPGAGGRGREFDGNSIKNGHKFRNPRAPRTAQGHQGGQHPRAGGPRHGAGQGPGHGQGQGNRFGPPAGQRPGRPGAAGRGPRPAGGGGQGRKRGR